MTPSITRMTITTPRYGSNQESKISALSGASRIAGRRMKARDDRLENLADAGAFLGAGEDGAGAVEADDVLDLPLALVGLRARQVDLVDDRDDLEVVLDRQVGVGERLRLDALRGVDQQQRALAGGERPRHLVAEVHVAGRVDQVEDVALAGLRRVVQTDGMGLDGDAALTLEIHGVEDLGFHLAGLERAGELQKAICQGRLAVVDVGDDREIPNETLIHQDSGKGNYTAPSMPARPSASAEARRVSIASAIGTTIEWYDFFIYGTAAATVFGPQFFPQVSEAGRDARLRSPPLVSASSRARSGAW